MSTPIDNPQIVLDALRDFLDPESGRDVVTMKQVTDVELLPEGVRVTLGLTTFAAVLWEETRAQVVAHLQQRLPQAGKIQVEIVPHDRPPEKIGQIGLAAKAVVAVASGKGGVGKSTMAVAIAQGLRRAGCKVGLMDADVYGPSIPHLLGVNERPAIDNEKIQPIEHGGFKLMSMGFLVPPGEAVVWRGPMLHGAITQFLRDTNWGELDYLIIDMPPGTGDISLTLSQLLPLTGAVTVCTPQEVALIDAEKSIAMFRKVNIPMLGMVENMSGFICPDCNKRYDIFGAGGAQARAEQLDIPFLGDVPLNMAVRTAGDAGDAEGAYADPIVAPHLEAICQRLCQGLVASRADDPPLPSLSVL